MPGGGVALINAIPALDKLKMDDDDAQIGVNIVRKALEAPMRKHGRECRPGWRGHHRERPPRRQKEQKNKNIGYNVMTDEYVDMIEAGIIDPAKVTRGALENAASIAAMILTTEALITDIPEKEKAPSMPPGGGMDY